MCPRCFDVQERPAPACKQCGCALPIECAACGAVNGATASACYKCAARLMDLQTVAIAERNLPRPAVLREEPPTRKPIAVPVVIDAAQKRVRRRARTARWMVILALAIAVAA